MRLFIFVLALLATAPNAWSFEYLGVRSGQSPDAVAATLREQGYTVKDGEGDMLDIEKDGQSGYAYFCNDSLKEISVKWPYDRYPLLLKDAVDHFGPGELEAEPTGSRASEMYITQHWRVAGETHTLMLITGPETPLTDVWVAWTDVKTCVSKTADASLTTPRETAAAASKESTSECEKADQPPEDPGLARFHAVSTELEEAVYRSDGKLVTKLASEYLSLAERYKDDWNFGNAIHEANVALGIMALRKNHPGLAGDYLLKAGNTPGSPQLNSFGPDLDLANSLLKIGERKAVAEYLKRISVFWESGAKALPELLQKIERGEAVYLNQYNICCPGG